MTTQQRDKLRSVVRMVAEDMKSDAAAFDGKPFNGRTMAEYCGNLGAGIAALANCIGVLLDDDELSQKE